MKKIKMMVSAVIVFAVVGSAFAFKPLGQGSIYCIASGTVTGACSTNKVDFREDTGGSVTAPCAAFSNTVPHITSGGNCINSSATNFSATAE